ncbi:MAG: glycoside hydrolase family 2 [Prevotella sp.]|jgi:beta-galactosidase|nr:glycoside hydrolase family 2 [Prevotella sp.]
MRRAILFLISYLIYSSVGAQTSVAGLFPLDNSGRLVWNFNAGWRFHLGDVADAEQNNFNDQSWEVVSTPHTVQLMPAEASGCRNYQGIAWYRKHFRLPKECAGRDVTLHFEAIMGKQTIYVNGQKVKEHEGGYLPISISLAGCSVGDDIVVAIKADNSDDKTYPPGKKQMTLDFAYHGGIYRDVWLIAKNKVAITDALEENKVAGGGIFVHYANICEKSAEVFVNTEVRNNDSKTRNIMIENTLSSSAGTVGGGFASTKLKLQPGEARTVTQRFLVKNPKLWSPETPYLYHVNTRIKEGKQLLDGGMTRIGIRSFEFVGTDDAQGRQPGFYLNGKRYHQLVGANRHQDFAYVGNALPNSQQWRDAKRLRDAGFTIIRTAHYPQDPSFMDACDEMGLFIIVATPGWQYWNKDKGWDEKVHENTRNIIRRDRNHPCVLMWEPILNETRYPEDFALQALQITKDEYPYPYRPVAAADVHSAGVKDHYDVVYGWPGDDFKDDKPKQCIFTREFGELVDDWYAHNNLNRASRSWGERPMLIQAMSLYRSTQEIFHTTGQFIGGCQWHPFDHQRGYHPDPYWGGIYDAFRQKKTAFDMIAAVLSKAPSLLERAGGEAPIVSIAHEMTQFSEKDVTIFSNCDSVRLTMYGGEHCWTQPVERGLVIFKDAWDFFEARNYSYTQRNWQNVKMVAEGIVNGKVVCQEEKMPSRRSTKLRLYADEMGKKLIADGSDFIVVVCEVTDDLGHVRRLAKENIVFTVEGEGEIIGDASINANPRAVEWGSAPVLIRSTRQAGKIKVKAEVQFPGTHAPTPAELEIESVPYDVPMCLASDASATSTTSTTSTIRNNSPTLTDAEKNKLLQEVEAQQADFGLQK